MKFESVTGKASVYVYQDFWAQVLVYNMVQDIRNSADEAVVVTGRENGSKYPVHTNENIAIGLFKEAMLKIFLEPEEKKRLKKLEELQEEMERYVLPIRELPGKKRRKNISNKVSDTKHTVMKRSACCDILYQNIHFLFILCSLSRQLSGNVSDQGRYASSNSGWFR